MSAARVADLLSALRRAGALYRLYGPDHPLTAEAAAQAVGAADLLPRSDGEAVVTVLDEGVYLERSLLPAVSLAYDGLLRAIHRSEVESMTFRPPVQLTDMQTLVARLSGTPGPGPRGGSVLINQAPWWREDQVRAQASPKREAYTASLEALRSLERAVGLAEPTSLSPAADAVRSLVEVCIRQPAAALLLTTMKSHHEYTLYHSVNTCLLSLTMGQAAGIDGEEQVLLGMSGLLHDAGKLALPPALLDTPGQLSQEEWQQMRHHPQLGAQMILTAAEPGQEVVAAVALEHHVGHDGAGYPSLWGRPGGGDALHPFTRLVTVADVYDAITTRRAYRRAETPARALGALKDGAGTSFDPEVVAGFIDLMGIYPPGSLLRLTAGETVMVIAPPDGGPMEAVLVTDAAGVRLANPEPRSLRPDDVAAPLTEEEAGMSPADVLGLLDEEPTAGLVAGTS
jgi:HD-GYP domain-containing protein (c-di-GMP phosphodiesterase class II)